MYGIDLNKPILFKHASLRFFDKDEKHINRFCEDDVLLLVFDGILRFTENGTEYEIHPGEYHIQKHNTYQSGDYTSDSPKYLYVHFNAEWTADCPILSYSGKYNYNQMKPLFEKLDCLSHNNSTMIEKNAAFFQILTTLYNPHKEKNIADEIADFILRENKNNLTLDLIAKEFSFSKNQIINIFKKKYKTTPIEYADRMKINKAMYLMEVTSKSVELIAYESGFNTYSNFYRMFYRYNNMSPKEWRKRQRINPN